MCRYSESTYKEPFACFDCRKVFKQTSRWELPPDRRPQSGEARCVPCPQCAQPMADMGRDFKAPKRNDIEQWKKVRLLYDHGFTFHSCGCCGPGYRPQDLSEVFDFVEAKRSQTEGELLLRRIREKYRLR